MLNPKQLYLECVQSRVCGNCNDISLCLRYVLKEKLTLSFDDVAAYDLHISQAVETCSGLFTAREEHQGEAPSDLQKKCDGSGLFRPAWVIAAFSHHSVGSLALWRDALRASLVELNLVFESDESGDFYFDLEKLAVCFTNFAVRTESCLGALLENEMATKRFDTSQMSKALEGI